MVAGRAQRIADWLLPLTTRSAAYVLPGMRPTTLVVQEEHADRILSATKPSD